MSKKKKSKKSTKWDSSNYTRDVLDGRFLTKPQARVKKIAEEAQKKKDKSFKKEIAKVSKKTKLNSKIRKKGLK